MNIRDEDIERKTGQELEEGTTDTETMQECHLLADSLRLARLLSGGGIF